MKLTSHKKSQVFVARNGTMETLHKGFLDLRKLGPVSMRRSSEILFDEDVQEFYIQFLEPELQFLNKFTRQFTYSTYELAVEDEIKIINEERLKGTL